MATIKQDVTLLHRPNLGEEATPVDFKAGDEVEIIQEWAEHYLCKNPEGQLFNIEKRYVDPPNSQVSVVPGRVPAK